MKTALEWLEDTLYPYLNKEDKEYTDVLFNKAKEMEKEQIINAFVSGERQQGFESEAEQYYKETYEHRD